MREASFFEKLEGTDVWCHLCRHNCLIHDGKRGFCTVRENHGGTLYTLVYGMPCAYHVDPIEKKPLYHFFPGSKAFSIATVGCNFQCLHCQNHDISQMPRERNQITGDEMPPANVVDLAGRAGCRSISYTYTEPTIFFEYAFDTAQLAKERGLANNFVTNGYIEEAPLEAIAPYLDGANIDLKAFSDTFYRKVCKADFSKVLDTIRSYRKHGIWIELTTLIIPGYNDGEDELRSIARFIREDLGVATPWHVSAFYPTYRLTDAPRTSAKTLEKARTIGIEAGLRYVYTGNIPGTGGEDTVCYGCGKTVIERHGFSVAAYRIKEGACEFCGAVIDGVGM